MQDLSVWLRNRGVSEAEIDEVEANSRGNQLLEDEELVLTLDVLCCGLPSRTVPVSIYPSLSVAVLQEVLGLHL